MVLLSKENLIAMVYLLVIALVILVLSFALASLADAKECLPSAAAVRLEHGVRAWSGYTDHMKGHDGERCYFMSSKHSEKRPAAKPAKPKPAPEPIGAFGVGSAPGNGSAISIANQIRWHKVLSERVTEWFAVYDQTRRIETKAPTPTFGERFASAFPAR